jgi:glycosyltransferase involved in cell wall biosynthesis
MSTVSVVISAYNEEKKIGRCLDSVKWATEIIVVDNGSTDKTVSIAEKYTDRIFTRTNNLMLNINKNYGFGKAACGWILSLDADEEIPQELADEIRQVAQKSEGGNMNGFWINRKNICFGKWIRHGIWWPDRQLRLFRNGKGRFPEVHVHEYLEVEGQTGRLENAFLHHNYESVSQYLEKLNTIYTENEVKNLLKAGYEPVWYDAFRFPVSDFLKIFFAEKGYRDGLHGIVLSLLQAFYSFIVFAKAWESKGFPEKDVTLGAIVDESGKLSREFRYWSLTASLAEPLSLLRRLYLRMARKLVSLGKK